MPSKVSAEITYPFLNFNGCTVIFTWWFSLKIYFKISPAKCGPFLIPMNYVLCDLCHLYVLQIFRFRVTSLQSHSPEMRISVTIAAIVAVCMSMLNRQNSCLGMYYVRCGQKNINVFNQILNSIEIYIYICICIYTYGSGHETAAVLLPGFATIW